MQILEYFGTVMQQVLLLFLMIAVGVFFTKLKLLSDIGAKQMANLLFYIITPAVIIKAFAGMPFDRENLIALFITVIIAIASHIISILISIFIFRKSDHRRRAVLISTTVFANCGFMSLPLADALYGEKGVFYVSVYVVAFNIIVWTYGVRVFQKGGKLNLRQILLSPGVIGIVLGAPLFFFEINLPSVAKTFVESFAAVNTPLAMILIGIYVATSTLRITKEDGAAILSIILRQFLLPALFLAAMLICRVPGYIILACMIPICAPAAANTVMFASKFDGDVELASKIMPLGTIVSLISMPLMLTISSIFS